MVPGSPPYREWAPPGALAAVAACLWESAEPSASATSEVVFPDACVDLVWDGRGAFVHGPDTIPVRVDRRPGGAFAGLRFRPGQAPPLLGSPANELRDRRLPLDNIWGAPSARELEERLAAAADLTAAAGLLAAEINNRLSSVPSADPRVPALVRRLGNTTGSRAAVRRAAAGLALGERQLHRHCLAYFGYGPKTLDRILRFQNLLARARDSREGLADLATAGGYADQAHLTRECRRLTGFTPSDLFKTGGPTGG